MKKSLIKGITCIIVFFISLIIISAITNQGNTDITVKMSSATYPLVSMIVSGEKINCLHGYQKEMNSSYLRDTITPISESRELSLVVDKYQANISKVSFEVRSVDGKRLVENTQITDYTEDKDTIKASFTLKDLIDENTEYHLIILLETKEGQTIRYYTRVIQSKDYFVAEKIAFVKEFHTNTFAKNEDISRYLESNSEGDNSSYHKVTIHSSFSQVTWGDLQIKKLEEPTISIKEIASQTASIRMDYTVSVVEGTETNKYRVSEFYRVRYDKDRMYLLDYERTMSQFFDAKANVFSNSKITLGITDSTVDMRESDDGNMIAFIQENSLYSYNITDNKLSLLFSFYDNENSDLRTTYPKNKIKILSVEETGNIRFLVYGYMNRGRYEGQVGVQVFYYNSVLNTVEESIYISYDKSFEMLEANMDQLSYVSKDNIFYLMLDSTIYSVDLAAKGYQVVVSNLREGSFQVSKSNSMIAWQTGNEVNSSSSVVYMNLNTKKQTVIDAGDGNRIAPLGFMEEDLVYGIAAKSDILKDESGKITFPMSVVKIQNERNDVLKEYRKDNIYVTDCVIDSNQITLKRVQKVAGTMINEENAENAGAISGNSASVSGSATYSDEDAIPLAANSAFRYEAIADDQIMDKQVKESGENVVKVAVTKDLEKIVQIVLKSGVLVKNMKYLTPQEVLFEGGRELVLSDTEVVLERYYVYGKEGLQGIYNDPGSAINLADEISGVVVNDSGRYVWMKGNLVTKNQIMAITEDSAKEEKSSVSVCLDTMLSYEGVMRNTEYMLHNGESVTSILKNNLENAQVLVLSGCTLESVLYYTNKDIPVMALLNDGSAVLIIGFNELNTVILDPSTGTIYKKGMQDSTKWFEENGNCFVTYLLPE